MVVSKPVKKKLVILRDGAVILLVTITLFECTLRILENFDSITDNINFMRLIQNSRFAHGVFYIKGDPIFRRIDDRVLQYELVERASRNHIQINSLGFRGKEVSEKPKPGETRIAVVGDSETFCAGLPERQTFPQQINIQISNLLPERKFDTLNLGVPGYNIVQEYRHLHKKVIPLGPSLVLLRYTLNDPAVGNPHILLDIRWLGNIRSYLLWKYYTRPVTALDVLWEKSKGNLSNFYLEIHQGRYFEIVKETLLRMNADLKKRGIEFVLFIDPDVTGPLHAGYPYTEIHTKLKKVASGNFPIIDPLNELRQKFKEPKALWLTETDPHKNAKANKLMGEYAARSLAKIIGSNRSRFDPIFTQRGNERAGN